MPLTVGTLPMPEGAKFVMAVRDTRTIMLRGGNDLAQVRKHFDTKLAEMDWTADPAKSEIIDGVAFLEYNSGTLHLTITLNPDRDRNSMTYMLQGSGVAGSESDEERDPDPVD